MALSRREVLRLGLALAALAAVLSVYVAVRGAPITGDLWLTHRIQDAGRLRDNADLVNALGDWRWVPFAAVVLLTLLRPRLASLRAAALWTFVAVLVLWEGSELLKNAVQSPRPGAALGVYVDHVRGSYGFPSGHVYGDVLVYGALAAVAPAWADRRLVAVVRVAAVAIVALAGPARVVVGAHWPSDVAGGYLWGGAALCFAAALGAWAGRRG
jgi:undecaprenyl-diphosphatase